MKWCRAKSFLPFATLALWALIASPLALAGGSSGHGSGSTNGLVCEIKVDGKGFIVVAETEKAFRFDFKFESRNGKTKGHFKGFDEESGICISGVKVTNIEEIDDQTVSIDLDVVFGDHQEGTVNIVVKDSRKSGEPDSFQITLADGTTLSGDLGFGCKCRWGDIKVKIKCKEKCKGKGFCKGHPYCDEHPVCEVPNCKGHQQCKNDKCKGHPECRKKYKHKPGCKAKINWNNRCSCGSKH